MIQLVKVSSTIDAPLINSDDTIRGVRYFARPVGEVSCHLPVPISIAQIYAVNREGQGFILVYSIASRATFDRLEVFRQAMIKVKRSKPIFMLVGNKCDKQYEREVSREEGIRLAQSFECDFLETSAKTSQNVERLFTNLVRLLRTSKDPVPGGGQAAVTARPVKPEKKFKCVVM